MLHIRKIISDTNELNIVRELFKEYSKSLNENLCFQSFDEELENPLKKYGEPKGCLLLAYLHNEPVGCIALQPLPEEGVCEMKRLYVRDQIRRQGVGDELVKGVLNEAAKKGYRKMVLDTLERLQPALKLYTKYGFVNTSAYYENPLAGAIYMEKEL
ncbi:GNAT family N-acetyltransferase [Segetibacter sp.]|jgi:putative acetyltransferase|uniref:GNAT family N-acetyltransferase n=1 Tax=Segetibacter sp. TaxID=2231182 RepID=UPI002624CF09|nr:GNAT family N-acetyltransferase [Segetibacter sp.]MCW3080705.1 family N-acetyltransferase [Segetibacter sp.]